MSDKNAPAPTAGTLPDSSGWYCPPGGRWTLAVIDSDPEACRASLLALAADRPDYSLLVQKSDRNQEVPSP